MWLLKAQFIANKILVTVSSRASESFRRRRFFLYQVLSKDPFIEINSYLFTEVTWFSTELFQDPHVSCVSRITTMTASRDAFRIPRIPCLRFEAVEEL